MMGTHGRSGTKMMLPLFDRWCCPISPPSFSDSEVRPTLLLPALALGSASASGSSASGPDATAAGSKSATLDPSEPLATATGPEPLGSIAAALPTRTPASESERAGPFRSRHAT